MLCHCNALWMRCVGRCSLCWNVRIAIAAHNHNTSIVGSELSYHLGLSVAHLHKYLHEQMVMMTIAAANIMCITVKPIICWIAESEPQASHYRLFLLNRSLLFLLRFLFRSIQNKRADTHTHGTFYCDCLIHCVWHLHIYPLQPVSHIVMFMSSFFVASCRRSLWRFPNGNQKKDINSKLCNNSLWRRKLIARNYLNATVLHIHG